MRSSKTQMYLSCGVWLMTYWSGGMVKGVEKKNKNDAEFPVLKSSLYLIGFRHTPIFIQFWLWVTASFTAKNTGW